MRILINALSARLGGGQNYLQNLLAHFPENAGWDVYLLCPDNFHLNNLPNHINRIPTYTNLDNPWRRALWENANISKLAHNLGADVLFCPGGLLPASPLPKSLKTVVTFQNMLPFDNTQRKRYPIGYRRLRDWLLKRGLSSAMKKADLVIFISKFAEHFIRNELGSLPGKTLVIPHGISSDFFPTDVKQPLPMIVPSSDYFLYVSFLDYYKSQIETVQAYAKLRQQTQTSAKLLLVGTGNPEYITKLKAEIQRLELEESVCLLGAVPHNDLPALYQHAQINLFASCTENCPNILLEIMAAGRPALVSSRNPMPEFAGDCVTYFDPENIEQLTQQWMALLSAQEHANMLAEKAKARVSVMRWEETARTTWEAIATL